MANKVDNPEGRAPVEKLDPALWESTEDDWKFFRKTISEDEAEVRRRVLDIQAKAYETYPYPCIYLFVFMKSRMKGHPIYKAVLEQAKAASVGNKPKLLDVGCCMGTELRMLLVDGYPSDPLAPNLIGCDLRIEFIQLGHELYQDGPTAKPVAISFYEANIFDEASALKSLEGKLNYIYTAAVFHLFDEATQFKMAERLLDTLAPPERARNDARGREYIMFGMHDGREQEQVLKDRFGSKRYAHSPKSWTKMWNDILIKRYGEDWVKSNVKQEAAMGQVYRFLDKPDYPEYHDFQWSVRITV